MTDKEFKRLGRAQLIDIIYQLQLQLDQLSEEKQELEKALEDKRLRLDSVGNIAEAALVMNDCFRNAQAAAEQYVNEIKTLREETEAERERILAEARAEGERYIAEVKSTYENYGATVDSVLEEYTQGHSDNG